MLDVVTSVVISPGFSRPSAISNKRIFLIFYCCYKSDGPVYNTILIARDRVIG